MSISSPNQGLTHQFLRKDIERFGELMSAIFDNNIGRVVGWGRKNKPLSVQQMARVWAVESSVCQAQFNRTTNVR